MFTFWSPPQLLFSPLRGELRAVDADGILDVSLGSFESEVGGGQEAGDDCSSIECFLHVPPKGDVLPGWFEEVLLHGYEHACDEDWWPYEHHEYVHHVHEDAVILIEDSVSEI